MKSLIEDSILIATFLGWEATQGGYKIPKVLTQNTRHPGATIYKAEAMLFHTSWDWLMIVVEKIESLGHAVEICQNDVSIYEHSRFSSLQTIVETRSGANKQYATLSAVTQFIKLYNLKNSENENSKHY